MQANGRSGLDEASQPGLRAPVRPSGGTLRAVQLAAIAASGPIAMWFAGFQVALWLVVALAAAVGATFASPVGEHLVVRIGVAALATGVLAVSTGIVVGVWLAGGAVFADWTVGRRPPIATLHRIPNGMEWPALVVLAPQWLLPNDLYRAIPFSVATGLALVLLAGAKGPLRRRWFAIGGITIAHVVAALAAGPGQIAVPSVLLLAASLVALALTGWATTTGSRWSLQATTGPLAWAAPAMVWVMVNIGIWVTGLEGASSFGHGAWLHGITALGGTIHDALVTTGVPCCLLGLVAVGAHIDTAGRGAWRPVGVAAMCAVGSGIAVVWAWTVQPLS